MVSLGAEKEMSGEFPSIPIKDLSMTMVQSMGSNEECKKLTNDSSCIRVEISKDFTVILAPRIKINFHFGRSFGWKDWMHISTLKHLLGICFQNPIFFDPPFKLPDDSIDVDNISFDKRTVGSDDFVALAEGCFYFRVLNTSKERLFKICETLVKLLDGSVITYFDTLYELRVFVALSEDVDSLLCAAGLSEEPPVIIVNDLPLSWFIEQAGDSEPSKLLRIFFESFGNVRTIDVSPSEVLVQYNSFVDLQKALKSLCSCSLQKEGTNERVEFSVMLKECEDGRCKKKQLDCPSLPLPPRRLMTLTKAINKGGATRPSYIKPLPELDEILNELLQENGVSDIRIIRQGFEKCVISQNLQLWLSNAPVVNNHFTLVARVGMQVQEIQMTTTLDREGINGALQRVFERVS